MDEMTRVQSQLDPATLMATRTFLDRISTCYCVSGARPYGSPARADHEKYSDADVAIFLRGARAAKADLLRTKLAMADVAFDILLETNVLISPLPIWEEDWDHPANYANPRLLENIRREGVLL